MVTLYNVISSDWHIADENGHEDFIPDELWPTTLEMLKKFDVLVMGRNTYETLQEYPSDLLEPFEALSLRRVVVSRVGMGLRHGYELIGEVEEAIQLAPNVLVSAGKMFNDYLLENHLVDKVILHQLPQSIGKGLPVFDSKYKNALALESESDLGLLKELIYNVQKN